MSFGAKCVSNLEDVIRQPQFDCGHLGDGGPLDTSCGAIHATRVPDCKNIDMPFVVAGTAKWVRDLEYERFCLRGDKEEVLQLMLDKKRQNNVVLHDRNFTTFQLDSKRVQIRHVTFLREGGHGDSSTL